MSETLKILMVEDNSADQLLARMIIESTKPNIQITFANDGQEALEILDNMDSKPDIILLDINMPRMNGHEFLKAYSQK